jgi:class 3 adenylate cyclase
MRRSPEIEALIRRYIDVRSRGDFALMRGLYSESDDFIAVGTREEDWIEGSTTFFEMVQADWDSVQTDHDYIRHLDAFENGETGWAVVEADRTTSGGQTFRYRLTVVYVLEAGVWRVLHSHFSIPEGAAISRGDLTATLSDLLDSVGDGVVLSAARTATVLFTDIVGSTALSAELGDTRWSGLVAEHFAGLRAVADAEAGTVVKTLGDGGMFTFDTGGAALRAARAMRDGFDDLAVRIGVHTGDLVSSHDDVIGATVAKAARVTAAAEGGQVLVSSTTAGIVNPSAFSYGPPVSLELKGLPGVHIVHELR